MWTELRSFRGKRIVNWTRSRKKGSTLTLYKMLKWFIGSTSKKYILVYYVYLRESLVLAVANFNWWIRSSQSRPIFKSTRLWDNLSCRRHYRVIEVSLSDGRQEFGLQCKCVINAMFTYEQWELHIFQVLLSRCVKDINY